MKFSQGQLVQFNYTDRYGKMTRLRRVIVKSVNEHNSTILCFDARRLTYRRFRLGKIKSAKVLV